MDNNQLAKQLAQRAWSRRFGAQGHEQLLRLTRFSEAIPSAEIASWDAACVHVMQRGEGRVIISGIVVDVAIRWHLSGPGIFPATQHATVEVRAAKVGRRAAQLPMVSDEPHGPSVHYDAPRVVELFD